SFTWVFPSGNEIHGANISTDVAGAYTLIATAPNGCEVTQTTEVTAIPDPEITPTVSLQMPSCAGSSDASLFVEMIAGGTAPYVITANGEPLTGNIMENIPAGNYLLVLTDANGCTDETTVEIPEPEEVTVSLGEDLHVSPGNPVVLEIQTNISPATIEWTGPAGQMWSGISSLTVPASEGIYTVVVEDANGCSATASLQLFVDTKQTVFVPNAFSPNGDGVNDLLTVFAGEEVSLVRSFSIFDRWGNLIYKRKNFAPHTSTDPPVKGWDGTLNGKALDPAVFVFMAEVEFQNGEVIMISGDVTLVK
ncbi:MAG TPA: gliding motility-associated C-terminal domain-containing protein, partial [Bacteroidetes bacterium]|nr:gliding motility-associated C-terminal domain-containing protein [Bacteroidota bacterium]